MERLVERTHLFEQITIRVETSLCFRAFAQNMFWLNYFHSISCRGSVPFTWTFANALVFKKVRRALGLDRCRIAMSAAAPIMKDTLEFFMSLDIPVTEIYGMSESTGNVQQHH